MNKEAIKSAVSIEFGLSIKEAGRIVDIVFEVLSDFFRKNRNFEIRKFGKIDVIAIRDERNRKIQTLSFIPSKKLARRVNHNFENLKKAKLEAEWKEETADEEKLDYKVSEEFIEKMKEDKDDVLEIVLDDAPEIITEPRTLISDKTIKLHKEITSGEKDNSGKTDLWG